MTIPKLPHVPQMTSAAGRLSGAIPQRSTGTSAATGTRTISASPPARAATRTSSRYDGGKFQKARILRPPPSPADQHRLVVPLRTRVRDAIAHAWDGAVESGDLPVPTADERPTVEIDRPSHPEHGDLSTNLAMKLARPYRRAPLAIASAIVSQLRADAAADSSSAIARVEVAPPGFINV